jgi:hypothetical protein
MLAQFPYMEGWMDLGVRWKVKVIGNKTNAFQYLIQVVETWQELHGRPHSDTVLAVRL